MVGAMLGAMVCAIRNAGGGNAATGAVFAVAVATIENPVTKPSVDIRTPPIPLDQECPANL
jgi:hypothetical protein